MADEIKRVQVALRNPLGESHSVAMPEQVVLNTPQGTSVLSEKSYHFEPPSFTINFTVENTRDLVALFSKANQPDPKQGIFRLDAEGRVIAFIFIRLPRKELKKPSWWNKTKSENLKHLWEVSRTKQANQNVGPGWYYVSALDQEVWKWALMYGLQLEDAIVELNRLWRRDFSGVI